MAASLYSIGLSGIQASNALITTTGQNTSNVNTAGFNRQTTVLSSTLNGGVEVRDTERVVDQFLNQQVRADTSLNHYYEKFYQLASTADEIVGDQSVSLNTYLDNMFSALQSVNADPTNLATRDSAFNNFNNMVSQYNELAGFVEDQNQLANNQLNSVIDEINQLSAQVANLNEKILVQETVGGRVANELRDQQEELARSISEMIEVKLSYDSNGLMELQLKNGQPLVLQDDTKTLKLSPNELDPTEYDLTLDFGRYEIGLNNDSLGGQLGALMDYRNDMLTEMDRRLGQQAIVLADTMNEQNKLGLDYNGEYGKNLFSLDAVQINQKADNSSLSHSVKVRPEAGKSSEITTDTYNLTMTSATTFDVKGFDANGKANGVLVSVDLATAVPSADGYVSIPGLGIEVRLQADPTVPFENGDLYQFTPTSGAARGLDVSMGSGEQLALNAPVTVSSASANISDANISLSNITDTDPATSSFVFGGGLDPAAPQSIRFTLSDEYEVLDGGGNVLATVSGVTDYNNLLDQAGLAASGYDVSISSVPTPGDSFAMAFNTAGRGDNFNGLKLAELQNKGVIEGGRSFTQSYTALVTNVGSEARSLKLNLDSSDIVLQQSLNRRDEVSGVSMDEEAVKLVRFQQSYSASAQVITAARDTFQALLSAVR
ncbi:flagellar hook-associated protein FlgK [Marinomonas algicola]|uniref:flagellar hook-associated protein FlgK n=1 Tax=Marinomonas algicola TaxID=2773454 RepID=UPI00174BB76A|nr:flagellar hook-associated protein FlgK [Marinomonas algicola]